MPLVEIDTVGAVGVIRDEEPYRIDTAAWSDVLNVRAVDGRIVSVGGRQQIFGTPLAVPLFIVPITDSVGTSWVYMSATKGSLWNGASHTDITRAASPYATTPYEQWNGVVFGGVLIVNNGLDVPQSLANTSPGTKLVDLPNWQPTYRARVLRALGPFLVAINITKAAVQYPHMVKWSHPADPGSVPGSWDQADTTKDAGENDLPDVNSGLLVDALNLRGELFLYKEMATWRMRYRGGLQVFAFDSFLDTAGLLAQRCVAVTSDGQKHFMASGDDILLHNGQSAQPIISKRMRRYLFSRIDPVNFRKSFVFAQPKFKEMWFCYPTDGQTDPDMALIWNEETGAITEAECTFVTAATGPVAFSDPTIWGVTGLEPGASPLSWNNYPGAWSTVQRREVVVGDKNRGELQQMEVGNLFSTREPITRVQRTGISIIGRKRDRSPIVDFNRRKLCTRLWPRLTGGPINVRMGTQESVEGPMTWTPPQTFDPSLQKWLDFTVEGASLGVEFSSQANVSWQLEGYKLDLTVDGEF